MCDQRERLLSYVYDEGDATERAEVQKHLDQCPDCRAEIAGLRSVRNDLLAWEVPAHEPVWRPFAAAPPVPWWKQVPAWAMAAAAGVVMLLGATGSVIAQSMMPAQTVARDTRPSTTNVVTTPVSASADLLAAQAKLAALEQQLADMGSRVERVSSRTVSVKAVEGDHNAMVSQLQQDYRTQLKIIESLRQSLDRYKDGVATTQAKLEQRVNDLTELVKSQIGVEAGGRK